MSRSIAICQRSFFKRSSHIGGRGELNPRRADSQSASGHQHRIRPQRKERESNPQGTRVLDRLPTGSRRQSGGPSVVPYCLSVARPGFEPAVFTFWPRLEAGCVSVSPSGHVRSVIQAEGKGFEPSSPVESRVSSAVRPTVSGCLPCSASGGHRQIVTGLTGNRTRPVQIENWPPCHSGVFPLDHEPLSVVSGPDGSRTRAPSIHQYRMDGLVHRSCKDPSPPSACRPSIS